MGRRFMAGCIDPPLWCPSPAGWPDGRPPYPSWQNGTHSAVSQDPLAVCYRDIPGKTPCVRVFSDRLP